jgi:L-fuculose-phosphate aldolase
MVKQELIKFGRKIAGAGLVAGAGGNISAREGNIIWMKPSGFTLEDMGANDLCGMDLASGKQVRGTHKPTSEVNMHLGIYRVRPEIKAVFHTHSPWASGVISAGITFKPMFAEFVNDLGRVGTVPYVTPTTQALADMMAQKSRSCDTIFMINHGVLAVGVTLTQAFFRCIVVEHAAISLVAASTVGKARFLSKKQAKDLLSLDAVKHRTKMAEEGR